MQDLRVVMYWSLVRGVSRVSAECEAPEEIRQVCAVVSFVCIPRYINYTKGAHRRTDVIPPLVRH